MEILEELMTLEHLARVMKVFSIRHEKECEKHPEGETIPVYKCDCSNAKIYKDLSEDSHELRWKIVNYVRDLQEKGK